MKSIGIDIGTTTISLVVLDTEKKMVLESRTISNGTFIETGNDWERIQEPVKIIEKAVGVLNELLAAHKDVETIGLTGQMHGIVYLDNEGECVSPLYTWQDGRGAQPEFDGKSIVQEVYE
ncbi:MAG: FGGY family carbohydrate kinase, partial [Clostridiaceae bacterium]|nr:FGGY family carbohydrate kinase [Clostridiaceae bacterium]